MHDCLYIRMYFTTLCLCTLIRVCTLAAVSPPPPPIQLHSEVKNAVYYLLYCCIVCTWGYLRNANFVYHTMCFCGLNLRLLACVNVNSQCAPTCIVQCVHTCIQVIQVAVLNAHRRQWTACHMVYLQGCWDTGIHWAAYIWRSWPFTVQLGSEVIPGCINNLPTLHGSQRALQTLSVREGVQELQWHTQCTRQVESVWSSVAD